jgi:CRP/FNR family transcriptional regulator, cyclic AMP receptor protein
MRKILYIFGVLNDADVDWMVRAGTRRQIGGGDILIQEGSAFDSVALLLSGRMTVSVAGVGEVAQLASGDLIGEMSLVDSAPPSATVAAKADCTALFLDKRALRRKLGEDIGFASRFYHALAIVLSDRLRATEKRMAHGQDQDLEDDSVRLKDELDIGVLDQVSMAGDRFDRLLKSVEGRA